MAQLAALLKEPNGIRTYGPNVRIVCKPHEKDNGCDLVVQKRPSPAFNWREVDRFDDREHNAATAADASARELKRQFDLAQDWPLE